MSDKLVNMRNYNAKDFLDIAQWFKDRGMSVPFPYDLPTCGKIVPGVAVGFLIKTDTNSAMLDFFVTNPKARMTDRGRAIDLITKGLLLKAKSLGFSRVRCDSQIDTIKKKALSLGFRCSGDHTVFCKEI